MVDSGTLATTAQVLLAIGENATPNQILEANTNIWILMAESDMSIVADFDLVANNGDISANFAQYLAMVAAHRAAFYAINQNQNSWSLATAQSKLNVCDAIWQEYNKLIFDKDRMATLGYTF